MKNYLPNDIWETNIPFVPHTKEDIREMLQEIGVQDIEELLAGIPQDIRLKEPLDLPPRLSELQAFQELQRLAQSNRVMTCFAGGGIYDHFRPSAIDAVTSRSEFYTAYTPYQPEVSQGTLQVIWEYQSLICELTGMDVANASIYCGGTALAEASALAVRHTHRNKVLVASAVHPHHLQILRTYGNAFNYEVVAVPTPEGAISIDSINRMIDDKTAAVVVQQPNFYGILEEALDFAEIIHSQGALYIISFDPISLGILKPPGEYGADIAVAEGQSLGNPLNYGGPYLGVMSAREQFVRSIPGRIAGETVDAQGRRGFVLTLQTREQHIRREKATSNICTNQALCALVAAMELCLLGKSGLVEMAEQSLQKAHYLAERITKETNFKLKYPRKSFFKEFLLTSEYRAKKVVDTLAKSAILVGPSLGRFYPVEDEYSFLVAVTESRSKAEMDTLVEELKKF